MSFFARIAPAACVALACLCLVVPAGLGADEPIPVPTPIPSLKLNDGRVLHNVQVRKDQDDSIVVRADEGLVKIAKTNLPKAIADAYPPKQAQAQSQPADQEMVMQPFNADPNQPVQAQAPVPKPAPKPTPTPKPGHTAVYKGLTIVSYQTKAFQNSLGCVEIIIRNDTDDAVAVYPGDIICVTNTGVRRIGRIFVTDGVPPSIKRQELVPAHGDIDDILTFSNDALDVSFVQWAR
jgi:hypothetical protein